MFWLIFQNFSLRLDNKILRRNSSFKDKTIIQSMARAYSCSQKVDPILVCLGSLKIPDWLAVKRNSSEASMYLSTDLHDRLETCFKT